jgi:lincosamide and streptogramin A transport system ATP-binding/permease protein
MMKRSKSLEKRQHKSIESKEKLLKNIDWADALQIRPRSYQKDRLISANNLSLSYGNRPILENLSFEINQGDRIAIVGPNGSGKSNRSASPAA